MCWPRGLSIDRKPRPGESIIEEMSGVSPVWESASGSRQSGAGGAFSAGVLSSGGVESRRKAVNDLVAESGSGVFVGSRGGGSGVCWAI